MPKKKLLQTVDLACGSEARIKKMVELTDPGTGALGGRKGQRSLWTELIPGPRKVFQAYVQDLYLQGIYMAFALDIILRENLLCAVYEITHVYNVKYFVIHYVDLLVSLHRYRIYFFYMKNWLYTNLHAFSFFMVKLGIYTIKLLNRE